MLALAGLLWAPLARRPAGRDLPSHGAPGRVAKALAPSLPEETLDRTSLLSEAYDRLPLSFEVNEGQSAPEIKFLARGDGYMLFLTPTEAVLSLRTPETEAARGRSTAEHSLTLDQSDLSASENRKSEIKHHKYSTLRMSLVGANKRSSVEGLDELPGRSNYFLGRDSSKWRTNVSNYARVRYASVYPGVDLEYYGNQRQLEYDFRIAPGASPERIGLALRGAKSLRVDRESGDLVLETAGGELRQHRPIVYQEVEGKRRELAASYVLRGRREVGFEVADYDRGLPLVIDPVLSYSTLLDGTSGGSLAFAVAVDSFGDAYVTGETGSPNFPTTTGAFQTTKNAVDDAFVTKFNANGTALIYSTYFGGNGLDLGKGIAVDANGNAYVVGQTVSTDLPVVNGFKTSQGGGDGYLAKLNPKGAAILYSTYIGGSGNDGALAVATDSAGNAYVVGITPSADFLTGPAPASTFHNTLNGTGDGFLVKVNTRASGAASFVYGTFLGGGGDDQAHSVALSPTGEMYVGGNTISGDFPTFNAFQGALDGTQDGFVTKLNAAGTALVFSTYLGGADADSVDRIAVDFAGNAYAASTVVSTDFPTAGAPAQSTYGGGSSDAAVTKFNPSGGVVYSTFIGGSAVELVGGIGVDSHGNAVVAGRTLSSDFPVVNASQSTQPGGGADIFVTKLNSSGSQFIYSTYLGGATNFDTAFGLALDSFGNAYVVGETFSTDYPTTPGAFDTTSTVFDATVTKLSQLGSCNTTSYSNSTGSPFTVGNQPASVAVGDFNGDGKLDLAVANFTNVSVLLGDGAGGFGAATSFSAGANPISVAVGDFNGDGKPDLAVANFSSSNVSVLLGDGAGSFSAATNFTVGAAPDSVAVGDFDGDGKLDLAVANQSSNNVSVLLGAGTGGFGAATNFGVGNSPRSVAVGDFNGDGKPDLAVANRISNNVSVLLGDGVGGFGAATNFAIGNAPRSVAVGDFNGDGKLDLAVAGDSFLNAVAVLLGDGVGGFGAVTNFTVDTTPVSVAVSDLNGDGKSDLVTANNGSDDVSVLLGTGTGSFGAATNFNVNSQPSSVAVGDFNGDGKPDLATANSGTGDVSVLLDSCGLPTSNTIVVTNTNDSGAGSLRQAIFDSNASGGVKETITFNIPGAGVHTITPTSALPDITDPVIIDGYTQPGASVNTLAIGDNAVLQIELNGASVTAASALNINAANCTVRGLVVNRFTGGSSNSPGAINVGSVSGARIEGNFIGADSSGNAASSNSNGLTLIGSTNATIGGATPAARNVISGNGFSFNVRISGGASGNTLLNNYIGANAAGTAVIANGFGVSIENCTNNTVGGVSPTARNVISGNAQGVRILGAAATGNIVQGNFIGTNAAGTADLGNTADGVNIESSPSNNLIGGATAGAGNLISGNNQNGVTINGDNNTVQGNLIGVDSAGSVALGNSQAGVEVRVGLNNIIGGSSAGSRNIISGNGNSGVILNGNFGAITGTQIQGNFVGVASNGTTALGNGGAGIIIGNGVANNAIGGTGAGQGNVIANNTTDGIGTTAAAGTGNAFLGNSIFANGQEGIDLGNNGVTANDTGDPDTGPNNLQNFPLLTSATSEGSNTSVHGTLNSTASTTYRIEYFSNATCDASGNGEGRTFLGFDTVTTDGAGDATIITGLSATTTVGEVVTATATDPSNNTSEFSQCVTLSAPPPPTLGNYANTSVQLGANTTVTPSAAPTNTTRVTVSTSTNFKGKLEGDPVTGVVRVTDAHPAGAYTVTVTAFDGTGATTQKTFTLTVTTPLTCNPVTFAAATNFGVGTQPVSVAIGDFNGDGKQDLAEADASGGFGAGDVSVVLGNGAGGFGSAAPFTVGTTPLSVVVGDFNGDGKQDLAAANGNSNNVSVLLGNGAGSFGAATNFGVGTAPISIAVGDFNGDGKQDLAAANRDSNNVSVLLGDGAGSFGAAANFAVGNAPQSVAVGDFNGDGKLDLVAGDFNSNNVSVLLGDGAGGFGAAADFSVGTNPLSVAVGDFNGDGKQDLATANLGSANVSVLLGDGAGSFSAATNFGVGNQPASVAVGDFDGDGKQDLASANFNSNTVSVLLGDGAGGFGAAANFGVSANPRSVAVGDFDGDGKQDLVTANQFADNVSILMRQCPPPTTFNWNGSVSADWFNGANWDTGTVPGATDTVVIPSAGVTNEPTITGSDATVASVTVQTGRTLTLSGNRLLTAATLTVDAGASIDIPSNQTGNVNAAVHLNGALTGNNANSLFVTDGATFVNNGTVSVANFRFRGATQTLSGTGSFTASNTVEIINGASVTLASNHTLNNLSVSDGAFDQGASFNLTVGPVVISSLGALRNLGTGDLTLAGDLSNAGIVHYDGGGAACGEADSILIRSSVAGTQRAWSGAGSFQITDVDVKDQAGTATIVVRSGTDSGNNGANWTFTGCAALTLTVNTTTDTDDGSCDAAHCSLREAINAANANVGTTDTIAFNIPGAGVHTIAPTSALPIISDPVVIDGYTQPGASANTLAVGDNAVLLVELNGAGLGVGLNITAGGSTVRGLVINRFNNEAVSLSGGGGNFINGNFLGANTAGASALGNAFGVLIVAGSNGNTIGGASPAARNLISGNTLSGVLLGANGNVVEGNLIGTNAAGNASLGNAQDGVRVNGGGGNIIGGTASGAGNVVSGNSGSGVRLTNNTANNLVAGNLIGVNAAGAAAIANGDSGVFLTQATGNTIGGATPAARNTISGNTGPGVNVNGNAPNNQILGNFIGVDAAGASALGNSLDGVFVASANTIIGGAAAGAGNCISGNGREGIFLSAAAGGGVIQGNLIGVGADGATALGNAFQAVLNLGASNLSIGGAAAGAGNVIAHSQGGVFLQSGTGNAVTGNRIFANNGNGLDLGDDGVTPNDAGDADTGANNLQNFPVLNSAATNGATTNVSASLNSTANTTFRIEFFSNSTCAATGNGEGETFIGSTNITTDGGGNATQSQTLAALPLGAFVTSTATDPSGNTSEFSQCRAVTAATFSISGRATDPSNQPLLGVNIHISGSATGDVTTDAAGNYSFANLPQGGNFTLTPSQTNFRFTPASRNVNNLQSDQTGVNFTGQFINHTITGRIIDAQGNGIAGVTVTLAGSFSAVTHTDAQGGFTFTNIPENGAFLITPEREGFTFNPARQQATGVIADVQFQSVGTVQPSPTPTPDQSDDFSGGPSPDPDKWAIGILTNPPSSFDPLVRVFLGGGLLHIQPRSNANGPSYSGLVSVRALDLNSTPIVSVEAVQAAGGEGTQTLFGLGTNSDNWFRFAVQDAAATTTATTTATLASTATPPTPAVAKSGAGQNIATGQTLLFEINVGGRKFSTGIAYDPALHRFWRFRYDAPARIIVFETSPDAANWTVRFSAQLPADQTALIAELSAGTLRPTANPTEALFDNFLLSPSPRMQFTATAFNARESDAAAHVQVIRTGSDESPIAVDFTTSDGTARAGSDYTPVHVTLTFGIGERLKTVDIPLVNDNVREDSETVNVSLSNPVGGRLGSIPLAVLTILDDDNPTSANPIDQTEFFVRQHYLDFLGREADAPGLAFWTNNIESCGASPSCRDAKRVDTSAAFFLSIEFQQTGFVVHRFYRASFGRPPKFTEYLPDLTVVREGVVVGEPGALDRLELNKRLFAEQWTGRAAFKQAFDKLNEMQYVDALAANAGVTLVEEERTALIVGLLTRRETRAGVLLKIVENEDFARREFNPAFVRMEYFGYLRRDPDDAGFQFWLSKLERFGGDFHKAEMVRAFLSSNEYRARFGQP
jgi:CSLREA domain-containing protein